MPSTSVSSDWWTTLIDFSLDADAVLIAGALEGCEESFNRLFEKYNHKFGLYARGFCRTNDHLDWESFVNVTWFKFWNKRASFDGNIIDNCKWIGWFEKCIRNQAIDVLRRDLVVKVRPQTYWGLSAVKVESQRNNYGHDGLDLDWFTDRETSADTTEEDVFGNLMVEELDKCLVKIGQEAPMQERVLRLRLLHHMTYEEIGSVFGTTRASVKSALFRGRRNLATMWAEVYPQ